MRSLGAWKAAYRAWLMDAALPLWGGAGIDTARGGFHELLGRDGRPVAAPRRARVQGRQSFVFALAADLGWDGPWAAVAQRGLDYLDAHYRRPDGLFRTLTDADGAVLDDRAMTYDQAFVLLAAAQIHARDPARQDLKRFAEELLGRIVALRRHPGGGFREEGERPFLSNPHMHLLEAALAWIEAGGGTVWHDLADGIVTLCLRYFIDPERQVLREFFDSGWAPLAGDAGRVVEPGHQFEWAWLLERWARRKTHAGAHAAARALFAAGTRGVDPARDAAMDEVDETCAPRRPTARLWPQTERLKAALILRRGARGAERDAYEEQACAAAKTLWRYLQTDKPGLWRDKMLADGSFVEEPAPASSLYHIICAVDSLQAD